jgi:hypothetical protein
MLSLLVAGIKNQPTKKIVSFAETRGTDDFLLKRSGPLRLIRKAPPRYRVRRQVSDVLGLQRNPFLLSTPRRMDLDPTIIIR